MKGPAAIGILAALKPKSASASPPSRDEEEAPASEAPASTENEYGSELARILGVSEEDTADFNAALSGFVRRCFAKDRAPETEE